MSLHHTWSVGRRVCGARILLANSQGGTAWPLPAAASTADAGPGWRISLPASMVVGHRGACAVGMRRTGEGECGYSSPQTAVSRKLAPIGI